MWLGLVFLTASHGYVHPPLAPRTRLLPFEKTLSRERSRICAEAPAEVPAEEKERRPLAWMKTKLKSMRSIKKEDLAKFSVASIFSYSFVSNVNSCLMLAATWATYRKANPLLSPINDAAVFANPLTWFPPKKAFLLYYGAYYATIGTVLRPFRFGIALVLAPAFDKIYDSIASKLNVPRGVAIFLWTLLSNVIFSVLLLVSAINVFCFLLQVPPIPSLPVI